MLGPDRHFRENAIGINQLVKIGGPLRLEQSLRAIPREFCKAEFIFFKHLCLLNLEFVSWNPYRLCSASKTGQNRSFLRLNRRIYNFYKRLDPTLCKAQRIFNFQFLIFNELHFKF